MAQVFSADAQQNNNVVNVPDLTETEIVSTNPLQVPFETAKAKILAVVNMLMGADQTAVTVNLYRNFATENLNIQSFSQNVEAPGGELILMIAAIDPIPNSRQVSYTLTIQQGGGADNGAAQGGAYIEAMLISG